LWSLPEGELLNTLKGHTEWVNALAISPDGKLLASGSQDGTIKLWSLPEGVSLKTLERHTYWINALAISPDGKLLVSGSGDNTIKLWSLPGGELMACAFDLAASPEDAQGVIYQITVASQTLELTLPCGAPIPDGAVCVCNCVGGGYCVCDGQCSCVGYTGEHYWHPN